MESSLLLVLTSIIVNKTSQCKVQLLVGHLVKIFFDYWLAAVILLQNRYISLLVPFLKDCHAHFRRLASDTQLLLNFSHSEAVIGVLNLCSIFKKKMETLPLEVDKELKHCHK